MPPEPFPWDRRDFRKHERSVSDPRFGGGFGGAGPPRWRDQHTPSSHPPPYHHHQQQQRRYSDFRSRPLPPGHGKHTGWHMHPDEAGHGFPPYGSRLGDRSIGDDNYRPFGFCSDAGRHFRNNRGSRGSFSQKYWRANSWETASSPHIPARSVEVCDQRFIVNTQAGHSSNDINDGSQPPDSANETENPQPFLKDQHGKDIGNLEGLTSTEKGGKESHLGLISWKPLKWSRSGSLSSKGSSLSRSSSSKSVGVDSTETVTEVQQKKVTPVQSPTEDGPTGVKVDTPVPSEETSSRKKPRLGWGEGLAKYEKKKVDGPEDDAMKSSLVARVNNIEETAQSHLQHDKSPVFVDSTSPTTPSSITFSSSPGTHDKDFTKGAKFDLDTTNFSCSPSIASHAHAPCKVGSLFSSDNLYLSSLECCSSFIFDMLQPEDPSSKEISHVGVNKLLSWKSDILKTIERTEAEIDSLETELRLLIDPQSSWSHPDTYSSRGPNDKEVVSSNSASCPAPLQQDMSGDKNVKNATVSDDAKHRMVDENNSTDCVILKCVKMPSSGNEDCFNCERTEINRCGVLDRAHIMSYDLQNVCDSILAYNQDLAIRAFEHLNKFLPAKHPFDTTVKSNALCLQRSSLVARKNFLAKKQLLRFKEKALVIKYKLFQHFWSQDQIVSIRKLRAMSHKKYGLNGQKKHRYNRSRMSAPAWNSRFASVDEVIDVVRGLLSESSFEPSKNVLKMPALILDKKGPGTWFFSDNSLVEDSYAIDKDRSVVNTWTSDEREIFIDKLATFGKDFRKIASCLDHKRTADCVEFYYKNHKEDCFEKTWKNSDIMKQSKARHPTYMGTYGKKWNREVAVASIDLLGEASAIVATADAGIEICEKSPSEIFVGASHSYKASKNYDDPLLKSDRPDLYSTDREAAAADVLAGICGSLSSEAMSSCITSSIDHGDGYHDWRCQRVGISSKSPFTPEVTQNVDDECSDESCGELDPVDWNDEEKSFFMQALSTYGRDFVMISQCVGTRSRDQCKVFFSKARKCLRLDSIQPELSAVSGDVNRRVCDIEDTSALETNLAICDVGLECKIEEHLLHPNIKLNHKAGDIDEETGNLKLDVKRHLEHSCLDSLDPIDAQPLLKNSLMNDCQINETNGYRVDVCRQNGLAVSSVAEPIQRVEASDCSMHKSIESGKLAFVEVLDSTNGEMNQEPEILSSNKNIEQIDANSMDISGTSCAVTVKTESQLAGSVSPLDSQGDVPGYKNESDHEYPTAEKSYRDSSRLDDPSASLKSSTLFSVPIKYQKLAYHNSMSHVGVNEVDDELSQNIFGTMECHHNVGGHTVSDTRILRGYPVSVPVINEEKNRSPSCNTTTVSQNASPCSDGNLFLNHHEFSLQKCNSRHHCEEEILQPSREKTIDQSRPQPSSSSFEKPSRTGDVKLFGKILTSSRQKPNACEERNDDNNNQNCKSVCSTLNHKCSGEPRAILDSAVTFDRNNTICSENIPVVNFGYWDGNRRSIQTGLPPMPDSAFLLAKYPAAFANYPTPTAKIEKPAVNSVVKCSDHSLNGVSVFPSKERCRSTGVAEYVKNAEVKPFTLDAKNPQDIFFSEMRRRNMLNVVTDIQQQSRGVTGRSGVVGGQCSGVSDPVAAIKMHYAKAERFSLQAGNIIEEDETWRSKRDLGR